MKKSYLIQGIEPDLFTEFKAACAHYNVSMRISFIAHMQKTVSNLYFATFGKEEIKPKSKE
ncbi:unnamed protein product [marine sediment metagenome]|uniref:Uncharacterized protein n=1 Tax=marine sediment metagenome TaxID=412755 RepID=X1EHU0_9ZZZZ